MADAADAVDERLKEIPKKNGNGEGDEPPVLASGWRAELVGHLIDELISGKKSIRIEDPLSEHPLAFDPVGGEDTTLESD